MTKLLAAYRAFPCLNNAERLVAYARKHSFVLCFLDAAGIATLAEAERMLNGFEEYINSEAAGI
jgi:hypothetical protein